MKIILHIGPPKTGSTAIQTFLESARHDLLGDGVLYPSQGRPKEGHTYSVPIYERDARSRQFALKKGPHFAHHLLAWVLAGATVARTSGEVTGPVSAESCWTEVRNEIKSACPEMVFISSENFAWLSQDQISALKTLLTGYHVKIWIYFRNPFSWLLSRYNQTVKKGRYHRSFRAFMQEQSFDDISYAHLMDRYARAFGRENVELRLFEKIKHESSLENDLINRFGIDVSKYGKYISSEKKNVSVRSNITNMLRGLNFIQHYFTPQSIHSTRMKRIRNRIIKKRRTYQLLNQVGKPVFSTPVYKKRDKELYTTISEAWLPEFLREYVDGEDWHYYQSK